VALAKQIGSNTEENMDTETIALISSAVTTLATEVGKGVMQEAGADAWKKIKKVLGLKDDLPIEKVSLAVESKLAENPQLGSKVYRLLQSSNNSNVKQLVGKIDADKVIVANYLNVDGDINM
jgi:hypothetical protein